MLLCEGWAQNWAQNLRRSREMTLLFSPKVTHHHGQQGGVLPAGKRYILAGRQMLRGRRLEAVAVDRFAAICSYLLRSERARELMLALWEWVPEII